VHKVGVVWYGEGGCARNMSHQKKTQKQQNKTKQNKTKQNKTKIK
jgi:hypothetical protein